MRAVRPTLARGLRRCGSAAAAVACLALAGCDRGDPLEAIRQQQARGDFAGSVEPLRELLEDRPDDAEVTYLYGRALVGSGQPSVAVWSLRKAMEDPAWRIPAGLQLAQMKLQVRAYDEVVDVVDRILEQEPDNVPALLLRAQAYVQSKKPDPALADADRVLELDPEDLSAVQPRVDALLALERKEEAREALADAERRMVERGTAPPGFFAWHCQTTARLESEAGDPDAAAKTWEGCLERNPAELDVVSAAMEFHDAQGDPERSLEIVRAAHEQAPDVRPLRVALSQRLVALGRAAEAEALLREETSSPNPQVAAAAWLDIGELRNRLGEHDAAAEAIEQALELARQSGSPSPQLEFEYADTLVVAGQLPRALEVAEELPVAAHRHMIRARVAQERRQPARALEEFGKGSRLWPDNPYTRYYAAVAAEELGDFERALEEYRYSVRNDPGATDARVRGAALLLAQGNPAEAAAMLYTGTQRGAPLDLEGHLLSMRIYGFGGNLEQAAQTLRLLERVAPTWVGRAFAEAAEGAARRAGPGRAVNVLATAAADYTQPRYAAALRAFVRFAHEAGEPEQAREALERALAAHPESGAFRAIEGLDLELSGAAPEARAAYERSIELQPVNPWALEGLGRLVLAEDPAAAVDFFERAAAADPSAWRPKLWAARALAASGRTSEAAERLDALLRSNPYEAEAAAARAELDLERGSVTARTLERAQRAVRFRGGPEALELLARVHEELGEPERAARATDRARAVRQARAGRAEGAASAAAPSPEGEISP